MAYLEGLIWKPNAGSVQETRAGALLYDGSAAGYPEWKFRVSTKLTSAKKTEKEELRKEKLAELASKITDGLIGEAMKVAMDIGPETPAEEEGVEKLIEALELHIVTSKSDEACDLYHAGTQVDGKLARQYGESMMSYVARRLRWYNRLTLMDENTKVSDNILTDYLVDCAKITESQKLMIRTTCNALYTFETVSSALRKHHAKIHLDEASSCQAMPGLP